MAKRSLGQWWVLACCAIVAGIFFAAPSFSSDARPSRARMVTLRDTGQTIELPVGQELVVTLPLKPYSDNYWYVAKNSGSPLKLIAGPNEIRPRGWTPWDPSTVMFYFRRESPGVANLVLEQKYWSKPMILKVVD